MHLHPPENSLCCRKIEFSIILHKREIKSSPEPYRSIFISFMGLIGLIGLITLFSHPQDRFGAGALHLPPSKRGAWSYEVRNSPLLLVRLLCRLAPFRRRFHRFRDELRRSESRRRKTLSCRTAAGAMHLHPPENSLCCRKIEFSTVW